MKVKNFINYCKYFKQITLGDIKRNSNKMITLKELNKKLKKLKKLKKK